MSTHFVITWFDPRNVGMMETQYQYDGLTNQKGYTFHGWLMRCIAHGKSEGFMYRGYRKGFA